MNTSFEAFVQDLPVASVHEHHHWADGETPLGLEALLQRSYVAWQCEPIPDRVPDRPAFLERVRHISAFHWFERALRQLYGAAPLKADTWDDLSERVCAAHRADPVWHVKVMRQAGRYERAIQDDLWKPGDDAGHPELFARALRINPFVMCHHPEMRDHNGNNPWALWPDLPRAFD